MHVRAEAGIDVGEEAAVATAKARLEGVELALLVNNAGTYEETTLEHLDFESIRRQIGVNALGPLRVTAALLPSPGKGSKLAIITSRMGSIGDNSSGGDYGYRMSKAAVNAAGMSLALDLRGRGVARAIIHPGLVKTDMTRGQGIEAAESVRGILARSDTLTDSRALRDLLARDQGRGVAVVIGCPDVTPGQAGVETNAPMRRCNRMVSSRACTR